MKEKQFVHYVSCMSILLSITVVVVQVVVMRDVGVTV